jgi:hypothetical protein
MTLKAAHQSLLAQLQLVDQSHHLLAHQLDPVTHLMAGLLHPPVDLKFHFHTHTHKHQASPYMPSGALTL